MKIIGAGLAGLITAHAFPRLEVFEAAPEPRMNHRALLRFRSDAVSRMTGVEFKAVKVRKGIYQDGEFHEPTIQHANNYSMKCLGALISERSVWNLEPVTRYVAPLDFHERLVESVGARLHYEAPFNFRAAQHEAVISTVPMDLVLAQLGIGVNIKFQRAGIHVLRFEVPNCDVYQTVYFPDHAHAMYRASITGSTLIAEFVEDPEDHSLWATELCDAFALPSVPAETEHVQQKYGKIAPIEEGVRKRLVARLTEQHGIYSIGRFATWRNILLDDVVRDTEVVKRLLTSSNYDRRIASL